MTMTLGRNYISAHWVRGNTRRGMNPLLRAAEMVGFDSARCAPDTTRTDSTGIASTSTGQSMTLTSSG
jgi:hypothetical protein